MYLRLFFKAAVCTAAILAISQNNKAFSQEDEPNIILREAIDHLDAGEFSEVSINARSVITLLADADDQTSLAYLKLSSMLLSDIGDFDGAVLGYDRIIAAISDDLEAREDTALGELYGIADSLLKAGAIDQAESKFLKLASLLDREPAYESERRSQVYDALGRLYFDAGKWVASETAFRRALNIALLEDQPDTRLVQKAFGNLELFYESTNWTGAKEIWFAEFAEQHSDIIEADPDWALGFFEKLADQQQAKGSDARSLETRYSALSLASDTFGYDDPRTIDTLAPLAVHLVNIGREKEALDLVQEILNREEVQESPNRRFLIMNSAALFLQQERYTEAEDAYTRAADLFSKYPTASSYLSNSVRGLIDTQLATLNYDEAIASAVGYLQAAADTDQSDLIIDALDLAAQTSLKAGEDVLAERFLGWWADERIKRAGYAGAVQAYKDISLAHTRARNWPLALEAINSAETAASSLDTADVTELAHIQLTRARILLATGRVEEAEAAFTNAWGKLQAARPPGHPLTRTDFEALMLSTQFFDDDDQLGKIERVVDAAIEVAGAVSQEHANALLLRAEHFLSKGETISSIQDASEAVSISREIGASSSLATALMRYAQIAARTGDLDLADALFEESVQIRKRAYGENSIHTLIPKLSWMSSITKNGGEIGTASDPIDVFEKIATHLASLDSKLDSSSINSAEQLRQSALLYLDILDRMAPFETRDHEVFRGLQVARFTSASRSLQRSMIRKSLSDPALSELLRNQRIAQARINKLEQMLSIGQFSENDQNRAAIVSELGELYESNTQYFSAATEASPRINQALTGSTLSLVEAQALLHEDEVLLVYVVEKDTLRIGLVRSNQFKLKNVDVSHADLKTKVDRIRNSMSVPITPVDVRSKRVTRETKREFDAITASELFETLVGSWVDLKPGERILIVPDGAISTLPFSVLTPQNANNGENALEWLGHQHPITVMPNVGALSKRLEDDQTTFKTRFFGVGNPVFDVNNAARNSSLTLAPLPETVTELKVIADSMGVETAEALLLADSATERSIKSADLFGIEGIAFASHALMASETGLDEPAIALTVPNQSSDDDDGFLTASEVAQLKLNSAWVLLSACNTAAGASQSNEEWLSGLASAFLIAGTDSVIVSHWPVPSEATVELTTRMFQHQETYHTSLAEALRVAMSEVSQMSGYEDPIFWAGFSIVGDTSSGSAPKSN